MSSQTQFLRRPIPNSFQERKKNYDAVPISFSAPEPLIQEQSRRRPKAEPESERRAMRPQEFKETMRLTAVAPMKINKARVATETQVAFLRFPFSLLQGPLLSLSLRPLPATTKRRRRQFVNLGRFPVIGLPKTKSDTAQIRPISAQPIKTNRNH